MKFLGFAHIIDLSEQRYTSGSFSGLNIIVYKTKTMLLHEKMWRAFCLLTINWIFYSNHQLGYSKT